LALGKLLEFHLIIKTENIMYRHSNEIAQELGEAMMNAADKLLFVPELEASFTFELDDNNYICKIIMEPKK
jgi:hypothetical protein